MKLAAGILSALIGAATMAANDAAPVAAAPLERRVTATVAFAHGSDDVELAIEPRKGVRVAFAQPAYGIAAVVVCRSADGALVVLEEHVGGGMSSIVVEAGGAVPRRAWMAEYALLPTRAGAVLTRVTAEG